MFAAKGGFGANIFVLLIKSMACSVLSEGADLTRPSAISRTNPAKAVLPVNAKRFRGA